MAGLLMRAFAPADAGSVVALFVDTNRGLAPPGRAAAFEAYIERCIAEEISQIDLYYLGRGGGFWVAVDCAGSLLGTFGLEPAGTDAMELRRMYVAAAARRAGVARAMLARAEAECLERGARRLVLSTSELQPAALALYRAHGYAETGTSVAEASSNRTVGGGIRRFSFEKAIGSPPQGWAERRAVSQSTPAVPRCGEARRGGRAS